MKWSNIATKMIGELALINKWLIWVLGIVWVKKNQNILTETFNELEPQDFFRATEEAEISNFAKWRELNGEDSTPLLDASAAQKTLAPAIKSLADDIFGNGTYDRIQSI